jgi:hypothetical protein
MDIGEIQSSASGPELEGLEVRFISDCGGQWRSAQDAGGGGGEAWEKNG